MILYTGFESPIGSITIGYTEEAVVSVRTGSSLPPDSSSVPVAEQAVSQLTEYFCGKRTAFDFPIQPKGTAFQLSVWKALLQIPYGETRTYGQIAAAIGKPGAARAVGQACNRNPLWFVIPCHRVVGSNRNLTGYEGGLDLKQKLLDLEQSHK